ncbi:hypothetical protein ACFYNF_13295 [Streptomyces sp. NPDC006641]|uniref:hypothetical protein n=1 Tax=unclassified Streptomyces TaxID=2593676 RepID=UPI00367CEA1E
MLSAGAAVTLSWWGVHTVLSGNAYDPPRALPIADAARAAEKEAKPRPSFTLRPEKSPDPSESAPGGDKGGKGTAVGQPSAGTSHSCAPPRGPSPGASRRAGP